MLIYERRLGTEAQHYAILLAQVESTRPLQAHVIYFGTRPLQIADQNGVELVSDSTNTGLAVLAWLMWVEMDVHRFGIYEVARTQGGADKTAGKRPISWKLSALRAFS